MKGFFKIAVKAIENLAKISSETTSLLGMYQPQTPKALQTPVMKEQKRKS
jgi:cyclic lactone autoinducer peptide